MFNLVRLGIHEGGEHAGTVKLLIARFGGHESVSGHDFITDAVSGRMV